MNIDQGIVQVSKSHRAPLEILQITIRELEKAPLASMVELEPKGKGETPLANGGGGVFLAECSGEVSRGTTLKKLK